VPGRPPPAGTELAAVVAANLAAVRDRVASTGRDPDGVTIVAVTKGFGPETVSAAVGAGLLDIGENYAQELLAKASGGPDAVRWHFLGPVQRNKVKALSPHVHLWQAIDRAPAGHAVARCHPGAAVLVQVNPTGRPGRPGCPPGAAADLVADLRADGLDVRGLMAVGPGEEAEAARPGFRRLATLGRELGLHELSIGMSEDLEVAVEEGATMIRIGRALFGARPRIRSSRR
jgi:pyridoxal phosphate enzyme (YggS family)